MTSWETNRYYSFKGTNHECVRIATGLLNSYSLTKGCLKTLGKKLQQRLEFGFFDDGTEIIRQGESGRDVYLLCSGVIDVLVDEQVVVQMFSPTLVGDKGIVSMNSQRAATIRISGEGQALVIKIPMESFIRDFKDAALSDASFSQEESIFGNVFTSIQQRLFEYIFLQKSLWEQVTNTTRLLNQQIIAKHLDNQKDPGWNEETWRIAQNYLKNKFNLSWPANVAANVQTLTTFMRKYLDRKYSDTSNREVLNKKTQEWRDLLTNIGGRVLKSLADKEKPVSLLDLDLFNPNIYRMRLMGLQNQLEKRYAKQPKKQDAVKKQQSVVFYGKGERSNEFNLSQYLIYFDRFYNVKNPKRLLAQVAQKCALISAECENNFNVSVVKMQKFLEEVKSRNLTLDDGTADSQTDPSQMQSWITTLIRGVEHYRDTSQSVQAQTLGKIKFDPKTYPNFTNMLKSHRVKFTREQMSQAFANLINNLRFQSEFLSSEVLHDVFHLCAIERGDSIPEEEILKCYWIPVSDDIILKHNDYNYLMLQECTLFGGKLMRSKQNKNQGDPESVYELTSERPSVLFVLQPNKLPWMTNKNPLPQFMIEQYLPLMQWLIDETIEQFLYLMSCRDRIVKEWGEIRKGLIRSEKIAKFEKKALKLPKTDHYNIINWLNNSYAMGLDPAKPLTSNQISKKIYNFFLRSTTEANPELSVEQCGNQAYTKWRNLLYEVVGQIPALNKVVSNFPRKAVRPVLNILAKQLTPLLSPFMKDIWEKRNPLTSGAPNLNLLPVLHPDKHESCKVAVELFENIMTVFSKNTQQLFVEIEEHKDTLYQLNEQQANIDTSAGQGGDQVDIRKESAQQLVSLLQEISPK
ncbi:MAG: cyclic nucleotide-binding domain-containing protein [Proteobacteria bacterium]|nr:cyclic nucleotide-binding domain-containing protein [Pseudomonadota bacterium]